MSNSLSYCWDNYEKTNDSERHTSCSDKGAVTPIEQMMKERKVKKRQNMKKINLH